MPSDDVNRRSKKGRRSRNSKNDGTCQCLPKLGISLILIPSACGGFVLGLWLKSQNLSPYTTYLVQFPGHLLLRAFFMIMIPFLFCSIVAGVSTVKKARNSSMICVTVTLFLSLSTFSAIMGALAGHFVHPGKDIRDLAEVNPFNSSGKSAVVLDSMLDLLWNSVPSNIIEATYTMERTNVPRNNSMGEINQRKFEMEKRPGTNYMGLIIFSIIFGCALAKTGEKGEQLRQVFEQGFFGIINISRYFIRLLPIGMFFWMLREGLLCATPENFLSTMGIFLATVFGCIAFHQFILLPVLYLVIVRRNPITFHANLMPAILTAFGTASSIATLPVTIRCTENSNRVHQAVTRFVLPFGMMAHMNGGTFYMVLVSIFLAQLQGITIGIIQTVLLCLTAIILFIATSGTPSHGNPMNLMTAMAAVGIAQPEFLPLVISIDWFMERFRTVMNIVADCYVAAFVEKLCEDNLPEDIRDSVEFETPVIDGYDHRAHSSPTNICRTCGHQIG